ncbi:YggT family protein [Candidatus Saccharibacteria bacterium]|nr:YggT family protein [Candidatus Saccharibacteria bacterium]
MTLLLLAAFINLFSTVFNALIITRILLTMVARPTNRLLIGLVNITEPLLAPVRRLLPQNGQFDFSPAATVIGLYFFDYLANSLLT